MSTLREMILDENRSPEQRNELFEMFFSLSYHEPVQSKSGRTTTATTSYDVREQVCFYHMRKQG